VDNCYRLKDADRPVPCTDQHHNALPAFRAASEGSITPHNRILLHQKLTAAQLLKKLPPSASSSGRFNLRERDLSTHQSEGWVEPRADVDMTREIPAPARKI
jgi:hypothetical protein